MTSTLSFSLADRHLSVPRDRTG